MKTKNMEKGLKINIQASSNINMTTWNYTQSVPSKIYVACSGGVDSVAAATILSEWRDVTLLHFSHADDAAVHELTVVTNLAKRLNVELITAYQMQEQGASNKEALWRQARYEWFHKMDAPVVTGHTLDDAVEWYMMTCLRGRGEFMPHSNINVIRPFLLTDKDKLVEFAVKKELSWWEDPGNHDSEFSLRSRVRSELIPVALKCESGLKTMVKRRLVEKIRQNRKNMLTCM